MSTQSSEKVELVTLSYEALPEMFKNILDQTARYFNEHGEHPAQLKGITVEGQMISLPVHRELARPMIGVHLVDSIAMNLARLKVEPIVMVMQGTTVLHPDEEYTLPPNTKMVDEDDAREAGEFEAVICTYHDPSGTIGCVAPILQHAGVGKPYLGPWSCAGISQAEWHDGPMRNLYHRSDKYTKMLALLGVTPPDMPGIE